MSKKTKKPKRSRSEKGLAQELLDLMEDVIALGAQTTVAAERKELSRLRKALSKEADRLIEENLDESTKEYQKACACLEDACEATREAIEDVDSVKKAIDRVAKLVDIACKIAAA